MVCPPVRGDNPRALYFAQYLVQYRLVRAKASDYRRGWDKSTSGQLQFSEAVPVLMQNDRKETHIYR